MRRLKKIGFIVTASFAISFSFVMLLDSYSYVIEEEIQPYADIIEWRYKTENGKLYKRKFNYSKNKWVGNWIFIGNVS